MFNREVNIWLESYYPISLIIVKKTCQITCTCVVWQVFVFQHVDCTRDSYSAKSFYSDHGLRTRGEKITFTAQTKINSHSQISRYAQLIFCMPHRPKFKDFLNLCLHWVSVVRDSDARNLIQVHWSSNPSNNKT
jgi:hypothetical protein